MDETIKGDSPISNVVTFYHDIEQNIDVEADPAKCRQMVKEFLKLEKKYGITATYNIVGKLFQEQPDLIEWIRQEGHEIAFHAYGNYPDWGPEYYSSEVDLCRKVSAEPKGYRSPRSQWDQNTLRSLWENGFLWNAESDKSTKPYFIYNGLVRLPIATDDWSLHTNDMTVDEWINRFSELLKNRSYFGFGSHDCVASHAPQEQLKAWEKILQTALENNVLLVTFAEAADLFRRMALSRYYSSNAEIWNQRTKALYRTKRFQEMIRNEAEKIKQPIVADLGSGGGVLSSFLKDAAKKIYCVDNAPGMVSDVGVDGCIQACLGEVTDSNLPDDSIDLVICARIVEYLFWPDRLADEIKRIGKTGATYFVTFPAFQETLPTGGENAPDRIRHYFTPDEIQKWASQIGSGRLVGVQYDSKEPDTPEKEQQYREIEENPPKDMHPTNWVYIGKVENKNKSKNYRKTIPTTGLENCL